MNCPVCHTTEIYRTRLVHDYFGGEDTLHTELVKPSGKYDNPETGEFECVNGQEFEINENDTI